MTQTLELYDGSTTLDFLGSTYKANIGSVEITPPPAQRGIAGNALRSVRFQPRTITFTLNISGASVAALQTNIRALESMLASARRRQELSRGTIVTLVTQLSSGSGDISYRVLDGQLALPRTVLDIIDVETNKLIRQATLTLLVEPFGRLAAVTPSPDTLENEQDSTNLNYMDFSSLTGTSGNLLQLKIHDTNNGGANDWTGEKTMWFWIRSGENYDDDLFHQDSDTLVSGTDPSTDNTLAWGGSTSTASGIPADSSGGTAAHAQWLNSTGVGKTLETGVVSCGYWTQGIAGADIPKGIFRILARVAISEGAANLATTDMAFALGYQFGTTIVTPGDDDWVLFPSVNEDEWHTLDLGEIVSPPANVSPDFTAPELTIHIYVGYVYTGTAPTLSDTSSLDWWLNFIIMADQQEGMVTVANVGTGDRILIDGHGDTFGVYLMNASDVMQQAAEATGRISRIGGETTRLYGLRDDIGDPSAIQMTVTPKLIPLVDGM